MGKKHGIQPIHTSSFFPFDNAHFILCPPLGVGATELRASVANRDFGQRVPQRFPGPRSFPTPVVKTDPLVRHHRHRTRSRRPWVFSLHPIPQKVTVLFSFLAIVSFSVQSNSVVVSCPELVHLIHPESSESTLTLLKTKRRGDCLLRGALTFIDDYDDLSTARRWVDAATLVGDAPVKARANELRRRMSTQRLTKTSILLEHAEAFLQNNQFKEAQNLLRQLPSNLTDGETFVAEELQTKINKRRGRSKRSLFALFILFICLLILYLWQRKSAIPLRPIPFEVPFLGGIASLFLFVAVFGHPPLAWTIAELFATAIFVSWCCTRIQRLRFIAATVAVVAILSTCYASLHYHGLSTWIQEAIREKFA